MSVPVYILLILCSFILMETVAWFTHKYIMHGIFWKLHQDHHHKSHRGFFERNDLFFLIFAFPGILCFAAGSFFKIPAATAIGTGITLYGAAYFLVHDIFIHRRFKIFGNSDHWYFRAIRRAHKMHHKHLEKNNGECFGMLFVSLKYFRESKNEKKESRRKNFLQDSKPTNN